MVIKGFTMDRDPIVEKPNLGHLVVCTWREGSKDKKAE